VLVLIVIFGIPSYLPLHNTDRPHLILSVEKINNVNYITYGKKEKNNKYWIGINLKIKNAGKKSAQNIRFESSFERNFSRNFDDDFQLAASGSGPFPKTIPPGESQSANIIHPFILKGEPNDNEKIIVLEKILENNIPVFLDAKLTYENEENSKQYSVDASFWITSINVLTKEYQEE
jgi:hypothetical protein